MRPHFTAGLIGLLAGAVPGAYAIFHKPPPTIVQPQTTIVSRTPPAGAAAAVESVGAGGSGQLTRAEQRQLAAQWGELDQKEVDALSELLKGIPKFPLTIFCVEDSRCGDLQLDFDNAFETAHWETRLEKPLIDDTAGIATSSQLLRDAIDEATSKRFNVGIIPKNGPRDFLVIGNKQSPGLCHTGKSAGPCPAK